MKETNLFPFLSSIFLFILCALHGSRGIVAPVESAPVSVPIGVVLDFETPVGRMIRTSISLALEDFISTHANYNTRLGLHLRDSSEDVVVAAAEALDLLKNVHVLAIIGPYTSSQAEFLVNLGNNTKVPIVSFSATSPSLSPAKFPYFVRTTLDDSLQVGCIKSILKVYGWREVVAIYEDTRYGAGIIPYLVDALEEIDGRIPYRSVISLSASDADIKTELLKLNTMSTRVFVVHLSSNLGSRFFRIADQLGMVDDGYVYILTDGITNMLGTMNSSILESMQGVIGVRPDVPQSVKLMDFRRRWRKKYQEENPHGEATDPSIYCLRAYDTVWALAMAAERLGGANTNFQKIQFGSNSTDLGILDVSQAGPDFLRSILEVRFDGLAGNFLLDKGELKSSAFQIVNVNGNAARVVGVWKDGEISRRLTSRGRKRPVNSSSDLPILWPGESNSAPKGWVIPTSGKKLKIGVPVKDGFNEFVRINRYSEGNVTEITGFCIDVFDAVMKIMPYNVPYEFVPFENATGQNNGTYDELVNQVAIQKFDAVVGDTTILANRSKTVDFTLPFTESGWTMIVPVKNKDKGGWIFVKPWKSDLWIASFVFFVFTGFVVWTIEHRVNPDFRGPPRQHLGRSFYFTFSTMVFSHRENVVSNLSRIVIVVWIFVVLILQSSFTANLASLLTVQKLEPTFNDVHEVLKSGENVGYQDGSFIKTHLISSFGFDPQRIKSYEKPDEYAKALSSGTQNGGVAAIFDEIPYINVFLSKYCSDYTMAGPIYKADGFGFVFPKGSPIVRDVSSSILSVTEGETMTQIQRKWFESHSTCSRATNEFSYSRLSLKSFAGLFYITGTVSAASLLLFLGNFFFRNREAVAPEETENSVWKKATARAAAWAKYYDKKDFTFLRSWSRRFSDVSTREESRREGHEDDISNSDNRRHSPVIVSREETDVDIESPRPQGATTFPAMEIVVAR